MNTNLNKGTFFNTSTKFDMVGFLGIKFKSVVNTSLDGIKAILKAYKSGKRTINTTTRLTASLKEDLILFLFLCFLLIFV